MDKTKALVLKVGQRIRFMAIDNFTGQEDEAIGDVIGASNDLRRHRPDEFGNVGIDAYWVRDFVNPEKNYAVIMADVLEIFKPKEKNENQTMSTESKSKKGTKEKAKKASVKKPTPKKKAKKVKANNHEQSKLRNRLFDGSKDIVKAQMKKNPNTSKATLQTMIEKKFPNENVPRFFSFYMLDRLGLRKNVAKLKKDRPEVKMIKVDLEYLESQNK